MYSWEEDCAGRLGSHVRGESVEWPGRLQCADGLESVQGGAAQFSAGAMTGRDSPHREHVLLQLSAYVPQSDGSYTLLIPRYDCNLRTLIDERMKSNRDHANPEPPFHVVGTWG